MAKKKDKQGVVPKFVIVVVADESLGIYEAESQGEIERVLRRFKYDTDEDDKMTAIALAAETWMTDKAARVTAPSFLKLTEWAVLVHCGYSDEAVVFSSVKLALKAVFQPSEPDLITAKARKGKEFDDESDADGDDDDSDLDDEDPPRRKSRRRR